MMASRLLRRAYDGAVRLIIIGAAGAVLVHTLGVRVILTDSVPRGAYLREPATIPRRGDYVFVCVDPAVVVYNVNKGTLPSMVLAGGHGDCPHGIMPFVKRVVAMGGDRVDIQPDGVRVNGQQTLPDTAPIASAPAVVTFGARVLGADELWLVGRGPRSWDSRYFGPASLHENDQAYATIEAVAVPLLLVERWRPQRRWLLWRSHSLRSGSRTLARGEPARLAPSIRLPSASLTGRMPGERGSHLGGRRYQASGRHARPSAD